MVSFVQLDSLHYILSEMITVLSWEISGTDCVKMFVSLLLFA